MNSSIFKALGNETRLKIVQTLMIKEHNVTDLTIRAGKDQTTVSRHLATLVNSEIISQKRVGRNIFYKIIDSEMKEWLNSTINVKNKHYEKKELRNKIEDFLKKQRVKNE
ncbi:MAG TPA: metalloregulator ArsR/SmtB family transcription factor [Candidatus Poseidoniia archaeon]|jgi:ArsR family transcriptional regulator|nr:metalloregulator ArsR/SmtB family transcription factor [Candidatus Poseidoniia archaeon]|tara:strand:- start:153 stop:482 length:330 start_codon:yes stop_codon:yes gene_type:complete